jgi:ATP-dependent DNA ligase
LQTEAEDHGKFVVTGTASAYLLPAMKIPRLPAGFVVPAQPVPKPPVGTDWVHEIKHDGYRIIVRRDGPRVRLYSRNAYDWTARLAAIAAAAELIKANSFTIDGEAVVLGPDGLSRFEELSRREAARTAILYAFDLIEHDGEDLRNLPVRLPRGSRKAAARWHAEWSVAKTTRITGGRRP